MSKKYFEGWYFKHQREDNIICFIVGKSDECAFIQVITNDFSKTFKYALDEYKVCLNAGQIRVGESLFTKDGCIIQIKKEDMIIRGRLSYGRLTPLKSDIMGIFRFVPGMECRHGIISMDHNVTGSIEIDGEKLELTGGKGYIEFDKGKSFPSWYIWCQCNSFETKTGIMIAAARIPILGFSFTGTIASVYYHGKEYRFATYLGARVVEWGKDCIVIKQGKWRLEALFDSKEGHRLAAPDLGKMTRSIREQVNAHVHFKMFIDNTPFFNIQSDNGCVEFVAPAKQMECIKPIEI